jgi:hypothetical protein
MRVGQVASGMAMGVASGGLHAMKTRNPKSKCRNPKQIQNPKLKCSKPRNLDSERGQGGRFLVRLRFGHSQFR